MSWFFISGGQSIGASTSASVLLMTIQCWFPLGLTDLISLLSKGLSGVFFSTTVWKHQFFGTQFFLWSNSHLTSQIFSFPVEEVGTACDSWKPWFIFFSFFPVFFLFLFFFPPCFSLPILCSLQDFSSLTKYWTHVLVSESRVLTTGPPEFPLTLLRQSIQVQVQIKVLQLRDVSG